MNMLIFVSLLSELWRLRRRERWSRQQLETHQARSLRRLRSYAYAHSPFYRQFHEGLYDRPLQELPVLTKAAMMEHFDELVTDRAIRLSDVERHMLTLQGDERFLGRYRVNATSGSTGRRGLFLFNHAEWVTILASFIRAHEWQEGANYFPPRMRLAAVVSPTPWHMSRRGSATLQSSWTPTLRLSASDHVETMVSRLNEFQPELLGAYPSVMRALANEQLAGRLHIAPRYVYTGAEVLTPETRRRIEEAWGRGKLFDIYGATESGSLAAECIHHTGLHLFEDQVIFEVVDLDNKPVPPGVYGDKLLITVLFNRTQPLIRYEISDSVQVAEKQGCPCGRPFTLISGIQGRMEDILHFTGETGGEVAIDPTVFDQVMDRVPAGEWQVVQEVEGLDILLSGAPEGFSDDKLVEDLRLALAAHGARVPAIRVRRVSAIPRSATGKAPLIKSNLHRKSPLVLKEHLDTKKSD
jgi:phenylacetate-coenzyme A ligase PaaK-like adenylate-forming protein